MVVNDLDVKKERIVDCCNSPRKTYDSKKTPYSHFFQLNQSNHYEECSLNYNNTRSPSYANIAFLQSKYNSVS